MSVLSPTLVAYSGKLDASPKRQETAFLGGFRISSEETLVSFPKMRRNQNEVRLFTDGAVFCRNGRPQKLNQ